jgi:lipoprotein LprG
VTRLPKPALALLAVTAIVFAGACGGNSGTPTPPPITDPSEVITKSVAVVPAIKSLHLKLEVSGKVNPGALTGGSSGGLGLNGNFDLAGTTVEGDVDVVKLATDLKFAVPGVLGLTGQVIVVDGNLYYKTSLTGDKFTQSKLSDTVPVSIPSPGALASADITGGIASLRKSLDDAGAKATLLPDDKINGKDAYHVSISVPVDKINAMLAQSGSTMAGLKLDSASVDYWAYKDSLLPAKISIVGSAGTLGNLSLSLTLTDYGKSVTVTAPAASDIKS